MPLDPLTPFLTVRDLAALEATSHAARGAIATAEFVWSVLGKRDWGSHRLFACVRELEPAAQPPAAAAPAAEDEAASCGAASWS